VPSFSGSTTVAAPPEEVWKILYDPARFADWWAHIAWVEPGGSGAVGDYTISTTAQPDFPTPQRLETVHEDRRVVFSCMVTDLRFDWRLEPLDGGTATRISVHVDIPEDKAHYLDAEREAISISLSRLATLAFSSTTSYPT
jgi:uncharacterized protein YndB with AHSA1/START domain